MNWSSKLLKLVEELLETPDAKLTDHAHDKLKAEVDTDRAPHMWPKNYQALQHYNGDSGGMNKPLRESRPSRSERVNKHISDMKEMTHLPTKNSFIAYRGSTGINYHNLQKDEMIHDRGFTSVSLSPTTANMFAYNHHEGKGDEHPKLFRVHVHAGTKGHYMSAHDDTLENTDEKEFVIHPGSLFKVGDTHHMRIDGVLRPITDLHIHSQEE